MPEAAFVSSSLTSVTLPEGLTRIDRDAFKSCQDLQQVALPGNKSINVGTEAFSDIPSSCQLFLYAPGLDTNSNVVLEYLTGTWGGFTWANVYWGYKGTGSKLDPKNYANSLK